MSEEAKAVVVTGSRAKESFEAEVGLDQQVLMGELGLPSAPLQTSATAHVGGRHGGWSGKKAGLLSVSTTAEDAQRGAVSIALGLKKNGRPQIVFNIAPAGREGHSVSAQLLTLAKVVK